MELQVSHVRTGFVCGDDEGASIRQQFEQSHCLLLRGFIESRLLAEIHDRTNSAVVVEVTHEVGRECGVNAAHAAALLDFVCNDQTLFEAIRKLTNCQSIGCFSGRIYQMRSGGKHHLDWHDDLAQNRLIALSVNLGVHPYQGGVLEIADAESKRLLHRVANVGPGDAVLFRIAPSLVHRVTAVEGPMVRTAYAGWFRSHPSFLGLLGDRVQEPVIA